MIDADGSLCWRLLLIANSTGLWWAWWRFGAAWKRGAVVVLWCAALAAVFVQCGAAWALAAAFSSVAMAWLGTVLFGRAPHRD